MARVDCQPSYPAVWGSRRLDKAGISAGAAHALAVAAPGASRTWTSPSCRLIAAHKGLEGLVAGKGRFCEIALGIEQGRDKTWAAKNGGPNAIRCQYAGRVNFIEVVIIDHSSFFELDDGDGVGGSKQQLVAMAIPRAQPAPRQNSRRMQS